MANTNLITLTQPRSAAAEAYRSLRTNLMFSSVESPIQTLLGHIGGARRSKECYAGQSRGHFRPERQQDRSGGCRPEAA